MPGRANDITIVVQPHEGWTPVDFPPAQEFEHEHVAKPSLGAVHDHSRRAGCHPEGKRQLIRREPKVHDHAHRGRVPTGEPGHRPLDEHRKVMELRHVVGPSITIAELLRPRIVERLLTPTHTPLIDRRSPGDGKHPRPEQRRITE